MNRLQFQMYFCVLLMLFIKYSYHVSLFIKSIRYSSMKTRFPFRFNMIIKTKKYTYSEGGIISTEQTSLYQFQQQFTCSFCANM
jgi:hypothetical protein